MFESLSLELIITAEKSGLISQKMGITLQT